MALYVIGITGNDVNRNRRLALHLQTFLDQTYKDFYKTPNYRKYLQVFVENFTHSVDKTATFILELAHNRKLNISKNVLTEQLMQLGNSVLWDEVMSAKLLEFQDIAKKKPAYDFYIIIPDIKTKNQMDILRRFTCNIIFNFETVKPVDKIDYITYNLSNFKKEFLLGTHAKNLEGLYTENDIWYHHNKPEHYMKEFAKGLVINLNNERIYNKKQQENV